MTYLEILQSYHLTTLQWIAIGIAVFLLGLSKSGIKGIGIIIVVIMAFVFGEKASTGILLPQLICADVFAVIYYNRHAQWAYIKKLIPWMIIGVLVGTYSSIFIAVPTLLIFKFRPQDEDENEN